MCPLGPGCAQRSCRQNTAAQSRPGWPSECASTSLGFRPLLQSAAVEELHERDRILIEATATPPGIGSATLPGYGPELVGELRDAGHLATVGAMVADESSGRVRAAGRQAIVRYDLAPDDARRLLAAVTAIGRLLLAAGATEVLTGIHGAAAVRDAAALDEAAAAADPRRLHLAAFHPTGAAAAGADPRPARRSTHSCRSWPRHSPSPSTSPQAEGSRTVRGGRSHLMPTGCSLPRITGVTAPS